MIEVVVCSELKGPITHTEGVEIAYPCGQLTLHFKYCRDGPICQGGYVFRNVRAFRHKVEAYCTMEEIETSDCRLVEILDSDWVKDLHASNIYDQELWPMRHYRFFFPDEGCYEVVAESWVPFPDASISETGM